MRRWDVGKDQAQKQAVKDTRTATVPEAIENRRTKTCAAINRLKCRQDNQEHGITSRNRARAPSVHHTCILKHKTRHRGKETHRNTLRLRKGEPSACRHRLEPRDTNPS
ncbi:hypothetical protein Bca101_029858 [Brassica carinata]